MSKVNKIATVDLRKEVKRVVVAGLLLASSLASAQTYRLVDLGEGFTPYAINNNGQVAGMRLKADGTVGASIYNTATGLFIDINGGARARAINDTNIAIGNTQASTGAFIFQNQQLQDLGADYNAFGMSNTNLVSGNKNGINPYRASPKPQNPAIYDMSTAQWKVLDIAKVYARGTQQGVYADIYALFDVNDNGYAVGKYYKAGLTGSGGILMTPTFNKVISIPLPYGGYASAINNQNFVAATSGSNSTTSTYSHAYLYDVNKNLLTDLGTLNGGLTSSASDINEFNQVVGSSWLQTTLTSLYDPTLYHAFLWENGTMADLNASTTFAPEWLLTVAASINDRGDIVGTGLVNGASHGFLLLANMTPLYPPTAIASANVSNSKKLPAIVQFMGSNSTDSDGAIVAYQWTFGDGSSSTEVDPAHAYAIKGSYMVTLTVTDNDNLSGSTSLTINVGGKQ